MSSYPFRVLSGLLLSLAVVAVSWGGAPAELVQRVHRYWDARLANDVATAYGYELVSHDGSVGLSAYARRGGLLYEKVTVSSVQQTGPDEARARIHLEYVLPALGRKPIRADFEDRWVRVDGAWYHAPGKDPSLK